MYSFLYKQSTLIHPLIKLTNPLTTHSYIHPSIHLSTNIDKDVDSCDIHKYVCVCQLVKCVSVAFTKTSKKGGRV